LAKGDIARMQQKSSIIFARWQHVSRSWSCMVHLRSYFGSGSHTGSVMVPLERAMMVSC